MKTVTITTHRSNNYGAVLQAYALQQTLISLGFENSLLDVKKKDALYSKVPFGHIKNMLINIIINITTFFRKEQMKKLQNNFKEFQDEYFNLTSPYYTLEALKADPPKADCYITGSDQVWSKNKNDTLFPAKLLDFGDESVNRISYAASIGSYDFSNEQIEYFRNCLGKFTTISLRECQASEYIKKITGYECQTNIDPVFLLDRNTWSSFSVEPRIQQPYILCFPLLGNDNMQDVVNKIKRKTSLPVVSLQTISIKRIKADYYIFDASPREFLGLMKNASSIITTSFHGTAFSIIFEKPFYSLIKNYKSSRITNLLRLVGLEAQLVSNKVNFTSSEIDYTKVKDVINIEKQKAVDYLKTIKDVCNNEN